MSKTPDRFTCECDSDGACTARISPDALQALDNYRATFDGEQRVSAGYDLYIVAAGHEQGREVWQRYGAYCLVVQELT